MITRICESISEYLELPDQIELEFQQMHQSMYAETALDRNRIRLNSYLSVNDIVIPLVHELIHLHQVCKGQLTMSKKGEYVWEGQVYKVDPARMLYSDYSKLPWEQDVAKKQQKLLDKLLKN